MDGEGGTSGGEASVGDEGILLFEVGRESWAVVAAVLGDVSQGRCRFQDNTDRFGEDTDTSIVWFVACRLVSILQLFLITQVPYSGNS